MLRGIPLRRLDVLNLRLNVNRYFGPTCSHRRLLSDSPVATAAAAKDRRWVMLSRCGRRPSDSTFVADANTMAETRTSTGDQFRVSFRFAAPPSSSYLYYDFPESHRDSGDCIRVLAVHRESVLLEIRNYVTCCVEHFVYMASGACRPPSLSLLPVPDFPTKFDRPGLHTSGGIGLLRRGDNDLLVFRVNEFCDRDAGRQEMVVFCVFRPGVRRWELMEPLPVLERVYGGSLTQEVICVGDRFLCWIHYGRDFLLCDMADEGSPKVRHVGLPRQVRRCNYGKDTDRLMVRRMGAFGNSSVRFVSIHPHCCRGDDPDYGTSDDQELCCCDEYNETTCSHRHFVFTIKTWTMNLSMDEPLEWVEDEEIDGEEIWALPGYEGLPQAIPEWPVVCLDNPNVVCFIVSNFHFTKDDDKLWMIQLNLKTKTLLSVVQLTNSYDDYSSRERNYHLPAEIRY